MGQNQFQEMILFGQVCLGQENALILLILAQKKLKKKKMKSRNLNRFNPVKPDVEQTVEGETDDVQAEEVEVEPDHTLPFPVFVDLKLSINYSGFNHN